MYNILFSAIVYLSLETHFKDDGRKCAPKIAIQGLLREKERKKKSVCAYGFHSSARELIECMKTIISIWLAEICQLNKPQPK